MRVKYPFVIALLAITSVMVGCSKGDDVPPPSTGSAVATPEKEGAAGKAQANSAILGPGAASADTRAGTKGQ